MVAVLWQMGSDSSLETLREVLCGNYPLNNTTLGRYLSTYNEGWALRRSNRAFGKNEAYSSEYFSLSFLYVLSFATSYSTSDILHHLLCRLVLVTNYMKLKISLLCIFKAMTDIALWSPLCQDHQKMTWVCSVTISLLTPALLHLYSEPIKSGQPKRRAEALYIMQALLLEAITRYRLKYRWPTKVLGCV